MSFYVVVWIKNVFKLYLNKKRQKYKGKDFKKKLQITSVLIYNQFK